MELEMSHYIWNVIITFIIVPLAWWVRSTHEEMRRQDILLNKTREEIARDYVTRNAHNVEYSRLMDKIDKLDAKIDKLITN